MWSSEHLVTFRAVNVLGHLNAVQGRSAGQGVALSPANSGTDLGSTEVDIFASAENTHCPLFFSITDRSTPLAVDSLSHVCPRTLQFEFPVDLIQPTLDQCVRRVCRFTC